MLGAVDLWFGKPLLLLLVMAAAVVLYCRWRQSRKNRHSRKYYLERERLRKQYWGWN